MTLECLQIFQGMQVHKEARNSSWLGWHSLQELKHRWLAKAWISMSWGRQHLCTLPPTLSGSGKPGSSNKMQSISRCPVKDVIIGVVLRAWKHTRSIVNVVLVLLVQHSVPMSRHVMFLQCTSSLFCVNGCLKQPSVSGISAAIILTLRGELVCWYRNRVADVRH